MWIPVDQPAKSFLLEASVWFFLDTKTMGLKQGGA